LPTGQTAGLVRTVGPLLAFRAPPLMVMVMRIHAAFAVASVAAELPVFRPVEAAFSAKARRPNPTITAADPKASTAPAGWTPAKAPVVSHHEKDHENESDQIEHVPHRGESIVDRMGTKGGDSRADAKPDAKAQST
jgi:hypothetical protein